MISWQDKSMTMVISFKTGFLTPTFQKISVELRFFWMLWFIGPPNQGMSK